MSRRARANRSTRMPDYLKAAPFAAMTLKAIDTADPITGTLKPKPYVGVQFAAIPEFQGIATTVGQLFAAALSGDIDGR